METDRHASDGEDRHEDPDPHEYGYGEDPLEAAGTGGPRAADSGTVPADTDADPAGAREGSPGPGDAADPVPGGDPATGLHPATGLRGATTPRAVLRPVPEGFPTPPPRPARPNRRPAPQAERPATTGRPRGLLIAGISVAAVLLLVVVVGGGILAVRSFSPAAPDPTAADDPDSRSPTDQPASGGVEIGGAEITETSTEVGVRAVGPATGRIDPEGEFIIVAFEVDNPTDTSVSIQKNSSLETADETYPLDVEATDAHETDSVSFGMVPAGESKEYYAIFDVPIGSEPTGLRITIPDVEESGTLPLSG